MSNAEATRKRLIDRLRSALADRALGRHRVVAMHDFSFDRIIGIPRFDAFVEDASRILAQGGGLLPDSVQSVQPGGCAAGAATTLARLGVDTHFISRTDELGKYLLQYFLGRQGVNLDHVRADGRLALAACIEVGHDRRNIMINDQASFADFGFDDLTASDRALLGSADVVGIFDWCLNRKGTDLAARVCTAFGQAGRRVYLDTSDPAPRKAEIPELAERVFQNPGLAWLNLNENELCHYTGTPAGDWPVERLVELTLSLQARIHAALTVHTTRISIDVSRGTTVVPTFRIHPRRATGSGDTWNGGNIAGYLLGLAPAERLMLANAVAGYYCASERGERPALDQVVSFLQDPASGLHEVGARAAGAPAAGRGGAPC